MLEVVGRGDVLVVQAFGDPYTGCMGDMLVTNFKGRGGAGIVVDGCIRDWPRVQMLGVPVWTRGFMPNYASQSTLYPRANNVPSACSRVLVLPGDIIIADDDGAVVCRSAARPPSLSCLSSTKNGKGSAASSWRRAAHCENTIR